MPSIPGRAALEPDDVRLAQAELGGVLDRDHALAGVDERGEGVEDGRLPGAGAAADDQVLRRSTRPIRSSPSRRSSKRAAARRSSSGSGRIPAKRRIETAGPSTDERRDDHVDPRAVGEPAVGHRAELVDTAADRAEDALDHVAELRPRRRTRPRFGSRRPRRSIQTSSWPLTSTSSTSGSRSSSSSGPRPTVSRRTRSASSSRPRRREDRRLVGDEVRDRVRQRRRIHRFPPRRAPAAARSARRAARPRAADVIGVSRAS